MSVYNKFLSKCEIFRSSFAGDQTLERVAHLVLDPLLRVQHTSLPFHHAAHPFERFAAEELHIIDGVTRLSTDIKPCLLQEGFAHLETDFFAAEGLYRDRVEALMRWFWLYADAMTGLGDFDVNDWEGELL